ncbi:MAG: preprotein translocase subunit SecG [Luteolibacter sp.]
MIFAATDWLTVSINLLLILFVIICLVMTLMILMQRPKQEGLGAAFGGGMTDQMFGARTTNVLQRGTVWFASLFFILALALAVLIGMKNSRTESLISKDEPEETTEAAESTTGPDAEALETLRSLIESSETSSEQVPLEITPVEAPAPEAPVAEEETVEETAVPEEDSADR